MVKREKRIPVKWETYHSKDGSELTVTHYSIEKERVTYYKHGRVFTTKLQPFKNKLIQEEKI